MFRRAAWLFIALLWLPILAASLVAGSAPQRPEPWNRSSTVTPSAWSEPQLVNPVTIEVTDSTRNLQLNQSTDYILKCDNTGPLTWGLIVWGGRNVVLEDCTYDQGAVASGAAVFKNQTSGLWLHDVHFKGSALMEGIDLQEPDPNVTVVLRDVLIDEVRMNATGNHADVIQTWCGPARFLVDGLTASTDYQGLFLLPNQNGGCASATPATYDFRHVDIAGIADTRAPATLGWAGWFGSNGAANVDWHLDHVYFAGETPPQLWPSARQWADVTPGVPPDGSYVTAASYGATGPDESDSGAGATSRTGAYGAGEDPAPLVGEQR